MLSACTVFYLFVSVVNAYAHQITTGEKILVVQNQSEYIIHKVYVRKSGSTQWGESLIAANQSLFTGQTRTFQVLHPGCVFDLRVHSWPYEEWLRFKVSWSEQKNVNLCNTKNGFTWIMKGTRP